MKLSANNCKKLIAHQWIMNGRRNYEEGTS
jgi:hypothetical protein